MKCLDQYEYHKTRCSVNVNELPRKQFPSKQSEILEEIICVKATKVFICLQLGKMMLLLFLGNEDKLWPFGSYHFSPVPSFKSQNCQASTLFQHLRTMA